jgi:sugar phosphate isomerase/epimerase
MPNAEGTARVRFVIRACRLNSDSGFVIRDSRPEALSPNGTGHKGRDGWASMKLCFSTAAFSKVSLRDAIDAIAAAGYRGVEIMAWSPHAKPGELKLAERCLLTGLLCERKLVVSNLNAVRMGPDGPSWCDANPKLRQKRVTHTLEVLDLALEIDSPAVSVSPLDAPGEAARRDACLETFEGELAELLPEFSARRRKLLIEWGPGTHLAGLERAMEFVGRFGAEPVALDLDVAAVKQAGGDPAAAIGSLAGKLEHVHLADVNASGERVLPGKGTVDFPAVFGALRDASYQGCVTVSLGAGVARPADAAAASARFLRGAFSELE